MGTNDTTNIIKTVFYASPYASLPPGVNTAGITAQVNTDQIPSEITNPILMMRVRATTTPNNIIGYSPSSGSGTSSGYAIFQPDFPLATSEPYMIDLIWAESGTPPNNIDWNQAVASAPVTASILELTNARFDGTNLTANIQYGTSSCGVGAQVNVFVLSGGAYVYVGSAQSQDNNITVEVTNNGYPDVYFVSVQSAIPTTNSGGAGSYSPPFSLGPQSELLGIPKPAGSITSAIYNGTTLSLEWELDTTNEGSVAPQSSIIEVLESGNLIARYEGGPSSANFALGVVNLADISVQIATVSNKISSQPLSVDIITEIPDVTEVELTSNAANSISAVVSTQTASLSAHAYLMEAGVQIAGPEPVSDGSVTFQYDEALGNVGLAVVAQATSSDDTIVGPRSLPTILLATAPYLIAGNVQIDPSDPTKWKIYFEWERLPDEPQNIDHYMVRFKEDGRKIVDLDVTGTSVEFTTSLDVTKSHALTLRAISPSGGKSPKTVWDIILNAPELTSLVTTNDQIEVEWAAPSIPADNTQPVTYQVVVNSSDGSSLYEGSFTSGLKSSVPLAELAVSDGDGPSVLVNVALGPIVLQADASMSDKSSASPILAAPMIDQVTADPITNKSTLNWKADDDASSYTINFSDGTNETSNSNSYELTSALTVNSRLSYSVESVGTSNTVAVTGPSSEMSDIPVDIGNAVAVRYDGSQAVVSWTAVPEAKSYNIYVYDTSDDSTSVYSGSSTENTSTFDFAADASKDYKVYVQPVVENGAGLTGANLDLFTAGIFLSKEPAATAYPYNYIAESMADLGSSSAAPSAQTIELYLPELGAASGALGTDPITQDPFTMEPSGNDDLPYKLTIGTSAWAFGTDETRSAIYTAYTDFLKDLETPPSGSDGATPYGISLVQNAISRYMPQTFTELLFYNYGLATTSSVGAGYVDLRPGMLLRATINDYVNVPGYELPTWLNGYAGATVFDFPIGGYNAASNDWRVGFDGFLNTLSSKGALSVAVPANSSNSVQAGVAGAVDLYYPQFVQPFYRVYFPDQIQNPSADGTNTTTTNFTIVAAASYTDLLDSNVDPTNSYTAYFRGRSILEVMIKITVNDKELLFPVGTTVGNVLEQLGLRPSTTNGVFKTLRVYRSIQAALNNTNPNDALGPEIEIRFDWDGMVSYSEGYGFDAMNIPILLGDRIYTM